MSFQRWIKQQLAALDSIEEFDQATGDDLRSIIHAAEVEAAESGLPDAVLACQIREGGISPSLARRILHVCLAHSQADTTVPTDRPLKVAQAAEFLNVSPKTIYAACDAGTLRHLRIGEGRGTIRISMDDLEDFRRQNQTVVVKDYLS